MFNKVILIGNLTRDVSLSYTTSGQAVAKCGLAVTEKFKSNGETKEKVLFVDFTIWGKSAEIANQYLSKGSKILIEGSLVLDQWGKDGQKHSKHSINVESFKMLDSKGDKQDSGSGQQERRRESKPKQPKIEIQDDDDIPF